MEKLYPQKLDTQFLLFSDADLEQTVTQVINLCEQPNKTDLQTAVLVESLLRLRSLSQKEDLKKIMHDALSPQGLCSTTFLNNKLEELRLLNRSLFCLSNLRVSVYQESKAYLSQFEFENDLTLPSELNHMPNLQSAYLESLLGFYQLNKNWQALIEICKLAQNSSQILHIAIFKIALHILATNHAKQIPKVVSNVAEVSMMADLLANGPEKSVKQYIEASKDRLKNVYKQTKATQKPQVSGLIFSQVDFEQFQATHCLEDLLAQLCNEQQLKELISCEYLQLHPSFVFHLLIKPELKKEETLALIHKFLLMENLYCKAKIGSVLEVYYKITFNEQNFKKCASIANQMGEKNLQARAIFQIAINSEQYVERKDKLKEALLLWAQTEDRDQLNRVRALLGKFSEIDTSVKQTTSLGVGTQCCVLVLKGDVKLAHRIAIDFMKSQKNPGFGLYILKVYLEFEAAMQIKSEHCFKNMARESIFSQIQDDNRPFNERESLFDDFRPITGGSNFGFYQDQRASQVPPDRQTIFNASKILMTEGEDDSETPKFIKTASKIILAKKKTIGADQMNQFKQLCIHMIIRMDYASQDFSSALMSVLDCSQSEFEEVQNHRLQKLLQLCHQPNSDLDYAYVLSSDLLKTWYQEPVLWNCLGQIYDRNGEQRKSILCYQKALKYENRLSTIAQLVLQQL